MVAPAVIAGVGVGLQALGMISSFLGGKKASSAAERAAKKEAAAEGALTAERLRQLKKEEIAVAGETNAAVAASGVKVGRDSPLMILAEQASEFAHERQITSQVGATKAAAALQQGRDVGQSYKYQSYANLAKGASNIFSIMNDAGIFSSGKSASGLGPPA
jgi:hypothetical protein